MIWGESPRQTRQREDGRSRWCNSEQKASRKRAVSKFRHDGAGVLRRPRRGAENEQAAEQRCVPRVGCTVDSRGPAHQHDELWVRLALADQAVVGLEAVGDAFTVEASEAHRHLHHPPVFRRGSGRRGRGQEKWREMVAVASARLLVRCELHS